MTYYIHLHILTIACIPTEPDWPGVEEPPAASQNKEKKEHTSDTKTTTGVPDVTDYDTTVSPSRTAAFSDKINRHAGSQEEYHTQTPKTTPTDGSPTDKNAEIEIIDTQTFDGNYSTTEIGFM